MTPADLNNTYYVLRHGQSLANVQDLIVSHPDNGIEGFGLSETGLAQAEAAFSVWKDGRGLDRETRIFSSDFLRTRHTAETASRILDTVSAVTYTPLLRERFFGTWEKTGSENYARVWADDALKTRDPSTGVEPVEAVLERGLACLRLAEKTCSGKNVLLVSHGDTLQILMTFFKGWPPHRHRELPHLDTAEIRKLA